MTGTRRGGPLLKERGGTRARDRGTRQENGQQMARSPQRRGSAVPGRGRPKYGRRNRPAGWGNAAVAAAAALAGVIIGAATARNRR